MQSDVERFSLLVATHKREMLWALESAFDQVGYEVVAVETGEGALQAIRQYEPQLLLLDADLPGLDGFEVVRRMREDAVCPAIPTIMITDLTDHDDRLRKLRTFADDYLIWPFDRGELLLRSAVLLGRGSFREGLKAENERLVRLTRHDPLTGAYNRRFLEERLRDEAGRRERLGSPLSVAMLDLDRFKRINDKYGHPVGDKVLIELVERVNGCLRAEDSVARYGGEEFCVVLPHTDRHNSVLVAERIRRTVAERPFDLGPAKVQVTVSIGVAQVGIAGPEEALARADAALYRAKQSGRNRVEAG